MGLSLTGRKRKDTYTWLMHAGAGGPLDANTPRTLTLGDGTDTPLAITTTGLYVNGVQVGAGGAISTAAVLDALKGGNVFPGRIDEQYLPVIASGGFYKAIENAPPGYYTNLVAGALGFEGIRIGNDCYLPEFTASAGDLELAYISATNVQASTVLRWHNFPHLRYASFSGPLTTPPTFVNVPKLLTITMNAMPGLTAALNYESIQSLTTFAAYTLGITAVPTLPYATYDQIAPVLHKAALNSTHIVAAVLPTANGWNVDLSGNAYLTSVDPTGWYPSANEVLNISGSTIVVPNLNLAACPALTKAALLTMLAALPYVYWAPTVNVATGAVTFDGTETELLAAIGNGWTVAYDPA